jgi:diguanylate cyclase (GGDEF)-like protein
VSSTSWQARLPSGWWYDVAVLTTGLAILAVAAVTALRDGLPHSTPALVAVPLVLVVARFPMVLDSRDGGIEVGFDSSILIFLLCTLDLHDALVLWSIGVLLTQVTTGKRWSSKVFNIGVGIIAGTLASGVLDLVRTQTPAHAAGTLGELFGVLLAAVAYFATDYVMSAMAVALRSGTGLRRHLLQRGTLMAVACFVPFDTLGYLGAVVYRTAPVWALALLAVPLATLLIGTRAVTRGRENARRLTVLFAAAVRAQALANEEEVLTALADDARELLHLDRIVVRPTPPGRGEIGARIRDGDAPQWLVAKAMGRARSTVDADQEALNALAAVASDAFARLALTDEMVHVARHDPLTDLPNRGILVDRLTQAQSTVGRHRGRVALLFIDLDGFKPVNDRYGHAAGDALLIEVADRLRACVGDDASVARLGGDEFAVLLEDADSDLAEGVWDGILADMRKGFRVVGRQVPLSASAGIAYGVPTDNAATLLRKADLAMYEAKARGKSRAVTYEDAIGRSRLERLSMLDGLTRAVNQREIDVVYQPIVETDTGEIVGAEALARWSHDGRPVSPELFIGLAEETGLIVELGEVVLHRVAADAALLREVVDASFAMSVNISARQLHDPAFVGNVERATATMAGVGLTLEITERQGIDRDLGVLDAMRAIAARGVRFAIDDFGVGFSSISYLHQLPVQVIKADASLSRDIDTDDRASALLRSVSLMGESLGLTVVVEGIERAEQLAVLREQVGAPYLQGFLAHRPMPLGDLLAVLRAGGGTPTLPAVTRRSARR